MGMWKRFRQSFEVRVDAMLDQLEDPEAVAANAIREVEDARVRVETHGKAAKRRLADLERRRQHCVEEARLWHARAQRVSNDESRALECVRRMRAAEREEKRIETQEEEARRLVAQLEDDARTIDQKLLELRNRHASLAAREARSTIHAGGSGLTGVEALFDRWESRVESRETAAEKGETDRFAQTFAEEEQEEATKADLARIRGEGR